MIEEASDRIGQHLTSQETVELARIQQDPLVVGYAIMALDGEEIESGGAWKSMIAPVFSNIFDTADNLGPHFGEADACPVVQLESPDFEVAGLLLSSARVVIIKRKSKPRTEGLRSVG